MFRDVCMRQSPDAPRGVPRIEHWGWAGSDPVWPTGPARAPGGPLVLAIIAEPVNTHPALRTLYMEPTFDGMALSPNDTATPIQEGLAVLASYYGAENFGHHLFDNWMQFSFLREAGYRAMHADQRARGIVAPGDGRAALGRASLILARNCDTYDYAPAGDHLNVSEFAADCTRHHARFSPLSDFDQILAVPELQPRACFEYVVAGNANMLGLTLPSTALWDFRNRVYSNLGLSARVDSGPAPGGGVLILAKTTASRVPFHAKMEEAQMLGAFLRAETGLRVDVRLVFGPDDLIRTQIEVMAGYEHVVLPGGGAGFISMLVARGTHVLIPPYPGEEAKFAKAECFARVTLLTLNPDRTFDKLHVLRSILSPPPLAPCGSLADYRDLERASFTPLIRLPLETTK